MHILIMDVDKIFDAQIRRSKLDGFKNAFATLRKDFVDEATLQTSDDVSNLRNSLQGLERREVGA
jgi:hypothetical protein